MCCHKYPKNMKAECLVDCFGGKNPEWMSLISGNLIKKVLTFDFGIHISFQ
jgi:hypothetical protein